MALQCTLWLLLLLLNGYVRNCRATLGAACGSANATTVCTVENSECNSGSNVHVCVCKDGFTTEMGACLKALNQDCAAAAECVSNAECDTTCQCEAGFFDNSGLCSKAIGSSCAGGITCPGDMNLVCESDMCTCDEGYEEKINVCTLNVSGNTCGCTCDAYTGIPNLACAFIAGFIEDIYICVKAVSGTTCPNGDECDGIDNAFCDEDTDKCSCSPNFVMNIDTCVPENTAASVEVGVITFLLSGLAAIHGMFGSI